MSDIHPVMQPLQFQDITPYSTYLNLHAETYTVNTGREKEVKCKWQTLPKAKREKRRRKKKNHNLAHLSVSVKAVKSISPTKPQYFLAMAFNDARKAVELQRLCNLHKNSNLFLMLLHPLLAVSFLPPPRLFLNFFLNPLSRHKHSKDFFLTKVEKTAGI